MADEQTRADVIRRLRRAEGQLRGVAGMLADGRDCADVLTQLSAVSHAVDRAAYLLIAQRLRECVVAERAGGDYREAVHRLERSFLSMA